MAAPAYTEDLTDVTLAEDTTNWSHWGGGNIGLGAGIDFAMQGTNAVDGKISNTEKGPYYDNQSGITLGTGDHVFVWVFLATPGLSDTLALRGLAIGLGSASTAYVQYHVEGNDTYGASGRVARCYPIDYSVRSSNTGSSPYRTVTGSPGANPQLFGATANITALVKSNNLAVDAIRYGTGAYLTAGELISDGDASDNPCTFAGFSAQSDAIANRWGLLTDVGGTYEMQGKFVIGQNNAGTATLCKFQDSDVNIVLPETPHVASTFNDIVLDHASTIVNWTNINISALGTTAPGAITVNSANPTFTWTGGTIDGIGATICRSNTTVDGVTWRGCGQITSNGASFSNILVDKSSAATAMTVATLADISSGHFISDASNHAVELTGAAGTYTWNPTTSGYDTGTSGNGVQVTGGAITGNETIHITATTGTFIINVATGATLPSVSSAGAVVNVVVGQTDFTFTVNPAITGYEWRLYEDSITGGVIGTVELDGEETATLSSQTYTFTHTVDKDIVVQIIADGYEEALHYDTLTSADKSVTINLETEENT